MEESQPRTHFFISHSGEDLTIAKQLKEDLEKLGFKIWIGKYDLIPGTRWHDSIEENIQQSIAVLYLVSPTSRSSGCVQHEVEYAKIYKRNIIPLWVGGDTKWAKVVAFGLFNIQYIDLRGDRYEAGIGELARILSNLSDAEPCFTRYLKGDDDGNCLQEVDSIINSLPTEQVLQEERGGREHSRSPQPL